LSLGKIRVSRSESAVNTLFVPKPDGTKRWCMDMRPINTITIPDENKAPLQDISRERIQGAKYFTRLDLRDGYHHLRIREGDERYTAFITEYGLYEWTVACFGLRNAPAEFARYMNHILQEYLNISVVVYFDDIIIYSKTLEEHWRHVSEALRKLREQSVNLKINKCEFAVRETEYLGHVINGETTRMQEEKVRAILEWPKPTTLKHIEQFRGLAGYYRQYVERYSDAAKALNERIRKHIFEWKTEEEKAFQGMKDAYRGNQILILFDWEKQVFVHTDASDYAISAEISQEDAQGRRRPVLFYSRKLLPAEMNYSTPDKELLAIVQVLKKYPHYLRGTKYPVIIRSDHRNLRTFMTTKELSARQARWAEELCTYNFVIEHIKGKQNTVADALSRNPSYEGETPPRTAQVLCEEDGKLLMNKNIQLKTVQVEWNNPDFQRKLLEETKKEERDPSTPIEEDGYRRFKGLILVPRNMEQQVISRFHEEMSAGHQGESRTMEKIQREFYFPGMTRKVRNFIKRCDNCQKNKNTHQKPTGKMQKWNLEPTRPWQHITMDFVDMPEVHDPTQGKLNQMLVVVDRFSKFTVLIPTKKEENTEGILRLLWKCVFAIFGIPETITSDRDKIFKTEKWRQLMKDITVIHVLSTAHHQQTDGQTERKLQEVQAYLRNYLSYEQNNWIELTPVMQYALNDAASSATGVTPNLAVFGTERKGGWDIPVDEGTPKHEKMKIFHRQISAELEWTRAQAKRYYDKKRVEAPSLKKGDKVYLRRRTLGQGKFNIKTKRKSTKLDHLKLGPFKIEQNLDFDNYRLKLPKKMKIHPVFHISLLEPTQNPETDENIEAHEEEYDVERLLDRRIRKGTTEYKVRWSGYESSDDTWEPTGNLNCPEKIQEFEQEFQKRSY